MGGRTRKLRNAARRAEAKGRTPEVSVEPVAVKKKKSKKKATTK